MRSPSLPTPWTGNLARRLKLTSEFGAKLDSWGDFSLLIAGVLCGWYLWPDTYTREAPFLITLAVSYLTPIAAGFLKFGRLTSYHTWGAKISGVLIAPSLICMLAGGPVWPLHISTPLIVLFSIEEILITHALSKWTTNVPTFCHARKIVTNTD